MDDRIDQGVESCRRCFSERTIDSELNWIIAHLRPGLDVLDVGCGPGTITMDVARLAAPGQVIGMDMAEASVEEATERAREAGVDNIRYEVGDAEDLRYADRSFDLSYSTNVLPFLRDPVRALSEQKRVTRRSGWVIAQTDDRVGSLFFPPCPHAEKCFASLAAVSDPSKDVFVADYAFARKAYGTFVEAGFLEPELVPTHPQHAWVYAGLPQISTFLSLDRTGGWSNLYAKLLSVGAIDEKTLDQAEEELALWRKHPHAFYLCPSVLVAGQVE